MKCYKCDKEATGRLSPDMDIKGIGYCDKHRNDVVLEYFKIIHDS